jgi:ElaB/YqjD/DUF883 family membrane-anchored ribosome-binding protein
MRTKTGNGHNVNVEEFIEDLKVVVRDGEELLKASIGGLKQKAIARAKTGGETVRSHPYQSLAVVLGLGVLAGVLAAGLFNRETVMSETLMSED